ncbi:hypothetical protein JCM33374_g4308 [Metschnikowia sp. JCM 33374]|nr:hypothetical protein JCM33374_g4308 [Metschnikowia sp. JCM 33374]
MDIGNNASSADEKISSTVQPVPYAPPGYPPMKLQEFVFTGGNQDLKAFATDNSMRMFKKYNRLGRNHPDFARAKQNQNASKGLPLLLSRRSTRIGLGDTTFLSLFEAVPSPEARGRLYDKIDNRHIGEVLRRKFISYCRYRLQIKGVEVVIIAHRFLPIIDLKINDERFRFIKAVSPARKPDRFLYNLYLLLPEQTSLVDNMDSKLRVKKGNPLLGGTFHNLFPNPFSRHDRSKYTSPHKFGTFKYDVSREMFTRTRRCSALSMYTSATVDPNSNNTVEFRSFILVAATLILQSVEIDLQAARSSRLSSSSSSIPTRT